MRINKPEDLQQFVLLWNSYNELSPMNECKNYKHKRIINKLQNNDFNFNDTKEKEQFIKLTEILTETIYNNKNCFEKYGEKYRPSKVYEEEELNYCSDVYYYLIFQVNCDTNHQNDFNRQCEEPKKVVFINVNQNQT